ncbi:MAG: hypothetical protein CVU09_04070 [Bacteroidetes bacterium HGW-Bacteroidetes-4]|jgi:methyl-accepting chemotaxis protein|nr:MAG: hypothetical protein CVU09_04070 [Bacteroidetes bacterium HGW-Bacteroidetes-4]
MLKNLKIQNKLFVGFGVITLLVIVLGISNYLFTDNINDKKVDLLTAYEAADAIMESKFYIKAEAQVLMEILASDNLQEVDVFWNSHTFNKKRIGVNLDNAIKLLADKNWGHEHIAEKEIFLNQIKQVQEAYFNKVDGMFNKMYELIKNTGELESIHEQLAAIDITLDANISEVEQVMNKTEYDLNDLIVTNAQKAINNTISSVKTSNLGLMFFCLFFALLLSISIARIIVNPIKGLKTNIEHLGEGDLKFSFRYDSEDEVGVMAKSLTQMTNKLNEIIGGIMEGSIGIQSASNQINSGSQQISQSSSEAAASVEEISASVEQMASNIQQNNDNAKETEKIAVQSAETINRGNESVQVMLKSMSEIAERIGIINDIALQTNILALNAAVEAARAGEHGKGFAVVAAEVRKLAELSKNAATQIDELSINGVKISEEAGKNLNEIVPQIKKTAALVQEISAASMEQSSGAEQINESIQQLNQVTQQNASASEELAATAEELNSQAEQLREMISFFKM